MSSPFLLQILILIPVVFKKNFAILESGLDMTHVRFYGKMPVCQGCSSCPNASVLPTRHLCTHIVSRTKIVRALATRKVADRKAVLVRLCEPRPMQYACNGLRFSQSATPLMRPAHSASSQCSFCTQKAWRLNLVNAPEPTATAHPIA